MTLDKIHFLARRIGKICPREGVFARKTSLGELSGMILHITNRAAGVREEGTTGRIVVRQCVRGFAYC
jgi:hypothetical protein